MRLTKCDKPKGFSRWERGHLVSWRPTAHEACPDCAKVPGSALYAHCLSLEHVAKRHGVSAKKIENLVAKIVKAVG